MAINKKKPALQLRKSQPPPAFGTLPSLLTPEFDFLVCNLRTTISPLDNSLHCWEDEVSYWCESHRWLSVIRLWCSVFYTSLGCASWTTSGAMSTSSQQCWKWPLVLRSTREITEHLSCPFPKPWLSWGLAHKWSLGSFGGPWPLDGFLLCGIAPLQAHSPCGWLLDHGGRPLGVLKISISDTALVILVILW